MAMVAATGVAVNTHATAGSVTGTWGPGQIRVTGHVLVAMVSAAASTSITVDIATVTSGWTQQILEPDFTTIHVAVACFTKTATGADAAPVFTVTGTTTVAMDCMLYELAGANTTTPIDVSGVYHSNSATSGTLATMTATTTGNVSVTGEIAISIFAQQAAAAVLTWTDTAGTAFMPQLNGNGVSSVLQTYVGFLATWPTSGATLTDAGHFSTNTSAFGAGLVAVFKLVPAVPALAIQGFADNAAATVTTGGTTAPGSGTSENWSSVAITGAFPTASTTTQPPVQFTVCDPALPAEKMLVTSGSGAVGAQSWTVTRGAEGTTPVGHQAGFAIVQVTGAAWLNPLAQSASAIVYVNCDYTGAADATAAINTAIASLPTMPNGYLAGVVQLGPGVVKVNGPVTDPGPQVFIRGAGKFATQLNYYGAGDCLRIHDPYVAATDYSYSGQAYAGGIRDLTVDGTNATAGANGLHIGDVQEFQCLDVTVQNFPGAGSNGVLLDNAVSWCEKSHFRIMVFNCATAVTFTVSAYGYSSFSYGDYDLTIYAQIGQNGIVFQNGAQLFGGMISIRGNFTNSSSVQSNYVLTMASSATPATSPITGSWPTIGMSRLDINVETGGGTGANTPSTIFIGGNTSIFLCYGCISFIGSFLGSNFNTQTNSNSWQFTGYQGILYGDGNLSASGGISFIGPVPYQQSLPSNSAGTIQANPTYGDFFVTTLTQNSTIQISYTGADEFGPQRKTYIITQAASGGPYSLTWPASGSPTGTTPNIIWEGGVLPQMSATAGATDIYCLETSNGATWYGRAIQPSQVADHEQFVALTAAYTLTSQTTFQKLFNATANGQLTVPAATSYFFECEFDLTALSATSGTFSFGFGGTATITSCKYYVKAQKAYATGALSTAGAAWQEAVITTSAATVLVTASTTTTGAAYLRGVVRSNAAGTLIPQITLSVANAAIVGVNSWFRLTPVGSNTVTNVGNWS